MPAAFRDYYQTLGVSKTASHDEIRSAFRKLARQYHPDVAKDKKVAEEKFKEVNEAYEVLGDEEKRRKYDAYGEHWQQAGMGGAPQGGGATGRSGGGFPGGMAGGEGVEFEFGGTGFSDFFEQLFGSRQGRAYSRGAGGFGFDAGPARGRDVEADIMVTLEEVLHGSTRPISFRRADSGKSETYTVKVPRGVREGQRIRLAGVGDKGAGGGPPGDLFLRVKLQKHPDFRVEGSNLFHDLEIPAYQAVLGAEVTVPTLQGRARLKLPPGSQGGQRFRLAGQGLPEKGVERGDLYVVLAPMLPKQIRPEERELWEKIARLHEGEA